MYDCRIVLQLIIMAVIFVFLHILLKGYLARRCEIDRSGNLTGLQLEQIAKREKSRMIQYPSYLSITITVFSILFFYWSTQSLNHSIEISSIILGISGAIFVAIPPLSLPPTYWDRTHRRGTFSEVIFLDKGSYLHLVTGLFLIIFSFLIRLALILQLYYKI